MQTRAIEHLGRTFAYTDHQLIFPAAAVRELTLILAKWQEIYPKERTLVKNRYEVPSLFVRFDCVVTSDGVRVYEIQEGCAGVGYTGVVNGAFRSIRDAIVREEWPGLKVLRRDDQQDADDDLWVPRADPHEALNDFSPLIMRSGVHDLPKEMIIELIRRSVRPVRTHNDKAYGVAFGWWKEVDWEHSSHGEALPWDENFVLKPKDGFGSHDVMLWTPREKEGRATRTQILRALEGRGAMYLQPFIPPMRMELDGAPFNAIYRPYFMYSGRAGRWMPAHGLWMARPMPAIRIHGASDAISGPLLMEA